MTLRYLSVCSGIEAATVAWHPLGWQPFGFAEIEAFPSAVLAHHYGSNLPGEAWSGNAPPNFGDMTRFEEWPDAAIDVLVGGTPCQSYSVAGLRKGLDDPRGDLTLTYAAIARRYRPRWLVWENVPGVLSNDGGRSFASLVGLLTGRRVEVPGGGWQSAGIVAGDDRAYGVAWRVLDAQYIRVDGYARAVPQRRRRVFVVGYLGDWRRAAAVLFERESLCGHPPPRRETRKEIAGGFEVGPLGGRLTDVAPTLDTRDKDGPIRNQLGVGVLAFGGNNTSGAIDVAAALNAKSTQRQDFESETLIIAPDVAASLTRGAESAGKGGYAGRRQEDDSNIVAFDLNQITSPVNRSRPDTVSPVLAKNSRMYAASSWAVRRLMPVECERLQGFKDNYTLIPFRGKPAADGPRYKACGNSMAVPVMRWIGRRIDLVREIA